MMLGLRLKQPDRHHQQVQGNGDDQAGTVRLPLSVGEHILSGQRLAAMCAHIAVFQWDMGMVTQDMEYYFPGGSNKESRAQSTVFGFHTHAS